MIIFSYCSGFLSVSCPQPADAIIPASYHNQVNFNISVDWTTPDGIEILTFDFERVCLKGNNTDNDAYHKSGVLISCNIELYFLWSIFMSAGFQKLPQFYSSRSGDCLSIQRMVHFNYSYNSFEGNPYRKLWNSSTSVLR